MVIPVRILVTKGSTADCKQAQELIKGFSCEYLVADRGYDSNTIIKQANAQGMITVIPSRKHRKVQRKYDKNCYKFRHFIENTFLYIKQWRGIATGYAKNIQSFIAAIQIRCMILWANKI